MSVCVKYACTVEMMLKKNVLTCTTMITCAYFEKNKRRSQNFFLKSFSSWAE